MDINPKTMNPQWVIRFYHAIARDQNYHRAIVCSKKKQCMSAAIQEIGGTSLSHVSLLVEKIIGRGWESSQAFAIERTAQG